MERKPENRDDIDEETARISETTRGYRDDIRDSARISRRYKRQRERASVSPSTMAATIAGGIALPVFADLQGFVVNERFAVKEIAILANGRDLTHHVFRAPMSWNLLTKSEKSQACWLTLNHHGFNWTDGYVEYRHARPIVRDAIYRASSGAMTIYVKGLEKKKWLTDIAGEVAEQQDLAIETIDVDHEDIGPLRMLDSTRVYRCGYHTKMCALENVCKLHNWWLERVDRLREM